MAFDAPRDERDPARNEQRARSGLHHFSGALRRGEPGLACALLSPADTEVLRELARRQRLARTLELAQNLARVIVGGRSVGRLIRALGTRAPAQGCSFGFLGQAVAIFS